MKKLILSSLIFSAASLTALAQDFSLVFNDLASSYDPSDIYITFSNQNNSLGVTYTDATTHMSTSPTHNNGDFLATSIKLSDVQDNTFTFSGSSIAVYISYGQGFSNTLNQPGFLTGGASWDVQYQNFEITRTGGSGDQGNMTNINYFTAPMAIRSYSSTYNGGTQALQSVSYKYTTAQYATNLANSSTGTNTIYDGNNNLVRYVGPSTYNTGQIPYQNFNNYLTSVNSSGVTNQIWNSSGFNQIGQSGTTGYNFLFTFQLTSSVDANGDIVMTGQIVVTKKDNVTGVIIETDQLVASDTGLTLSGSDIAKLTQVIYGQSTGQNPDIATWGSGWATLAAYLTANDIEASALEILQAQVVGEISTAILLGFLGNDKNVNGTDLNTMKSYEWWQMIPLEAFDAIQSDPDFYNRWAAAVYDATDNGAYGIPYSDRLGEGPLVNSVQYKIGNDTYDIDKWEIDIFDPVSAVPEPRTVAFVGMGLALVIAGWVRRRRRD